MKSLKSPLPLASDALRASYGTDDLLPIEFFKLHADALQALIPGPVVRHFLSSGTTRADRSLSGFSAAGLAVYRQESVTAFQKMLATFFPEPLKTRGLSLIPTTLEWPDSSLAQMVAWIGEKHELRYWDGLEPIADEPVWVFGTAFHFVNLADDGIRLRLPKGSVVIETGGTKGRSRSVTREELYELIATHLGVPRNRIISEYGMCELASQAYDFVEQPEGPEVSLTERWFRFAAQSQVSLRDRLSREQKQGEGTLVIHDALRIDLPWPIRTEDLARVRADGAFQLLGRVPMSPLKGCSMLAEQIIQPVGMTFAGVTAPVVSTADRSHRAEIMQTLAQDLLQDAELWGYWAEELAETRAVDWLRADLKQSMPANADAWLRAAEHSLGPSAPVRWLIIPPETHSIAWLYPLLIASVLGLELHVRARLDDPLVRYLQKRLEPLGGFSIWANTHRIGTDPLPPVDAVMIYGSDETLAAVRAMSPLPIHGFGSSLTVSIMQAGDRPESVWKDAFSLLQRGCMSSRVVFLLETDLPQPPEPPLGPLPLGLEVALEHAAFALRNQGQEPLPRPAEGYPLLTLQSFDPRKTLAEILLDRPLSLPLVKVPKNLWPALAEWLPAQKNLHKIAVRGNPLHLDPAHMALVAPGTANAPEWNGCHQKRPLFEYNKLDVNAAPKGQDQ